MTKSENQKRWRDLTEKITVVVVSVSILYFVLTFIRFLNKSIDYLYLCAT